MDNKPKQKSPNDSSWKDENDRKYTPNRPNEKKHDFDTPSHSGQGASKKDFSSEPRQDQLDESQRDRQQPDTSRKQRRTEE